MNYTALIVDDEPNARDYLEGLIYEEPCIKLVGTCRSGNDALKFCATLQPDIIFLDIQMPGINGIETAKRLINKNLTSVIIFTTAFDQYAIKAFEVEAIGYLLKPFTSGQFKEHLHRAVKWVETKQKAQFKERINQLYEHFARGSSDKIREFYIKDKGLEFAIPVNDILYITSDSEYVKINTVKNKSYLLRGTLSLIAKQLPLNFMQIHRSAIINKEFVKEWKYLKNNTFSFKMRDKKQLTSSRSFQNDITKWLQ